LPAGKYIPVRDRSFASDATSAAAPEKKEGHQGQRTDTRRRQRDPIDIVGVIVLAGLLAVWGTRTFQRQSA
jgi:hypothetical protein